MWKYTDVKRLDKLPEVTDIAEGNEHFVFTINSDLPENTSMKPINEVKECDWAELKTDKERVFITLNMALLNSGFELPLPDTSQLK